MRPIYFVTFSAYVLLGFLNVQVVEGVSQCDVICNDDENSADQVCGADGVTYSMLFFFTLTFITLWANSADGKIDDNFLIVPRK